MDDILDEFFSENKLVNKSPVNAGNFTDPPPGTAGIGCNIRIVFLSSNRTTSMYSCD